MQTTPLEYANVAETQDRPLWWQVQGLSYTASGYGARIPTSKVVRLEGETRFRRVYCAIYSNIGTCYVRVRGSKLIVR